MKVKYGLSPVVNHKTKILILGSFPSEKSLEKKAYYANPRNQFWAIMSDLLRIDLVSIAYADRIKLLLQHQIGLWDIIKSCQRIGSSDASIKNVKPNNVSLLLQKHPHIKTIVINGSKNYKLFIKYQNVIIDTKAMPSTSTAYPMSYKDKIEKWMLLLK